jgi:hypothetical protein
MFIRLSLACDAQNGIAMAKVSLAISLGNYGGKISLIWARLTLARLASVAQNSATAP